MDNDPREETSADGTIDFSHYTREQVSHALNRIDEFAQPKNTANLLKRYRELNPPEAEPEAAEPAQSLADQKIFADELDERRTETRVVPSLIAINCVVFLLAVRAGSGVFESDPRVLLSFGTNLGPRTLGGEWWRLFTSMFIHFGAFHLAANMWVLWSVGRQTERLYGSVQFLLIYLLSGLSGGIASLLWNPTVNSAGASGAIVSILGAALAFALNPKTRMPTTVAAAQRSSIVIFIVYNAINGATHKGIDNAAHMGGLLAGFVIGWLLCRPLDPPASRAPTA